MVLRCYFTTENTEIVFEIEIGIAIEIEIERL